MQPFAMARDDAVRQRLAHAQQFLAIRGIFKTRQRGLRGQILTVNGIAAHQQLVHRIACQTCASLASSYPKAMPITRCVSSSPFRARSCPVAAPRADRQPTRKSDQPPVGRLEQDRAAIGTALALIKLRNHRPLKNIWKSKHSVVVCFGQRRPHFWSQTRTDNVLYHGEAFRALKS